MPVHSGSMDLRCFKGILMLFGIKTGLQSQFLGKTIPDKLPSTANYQALSDFRFSAGFVQIYHNLA